MASAWRPLHLHPKNNGIPPLLVRYTFGPSDYVVWLTDLSNIWTESLGRKQIIGKACSVDTSIDPSGESAQMFLFLEKLEDALGQLQGTSINLGSNDTNQLILHTSVPLPHPLQPLEWSFVLSLASKSSFTLEFVSPLLSQQFTAKLEKSSLVQQLKEKDNVISKLIDKMQGDGIDLGNVFPSAVSTKAGTGPSARRTLAKSIRGLGEFDKDRWENQVAKDIEFPKDLDDVLTQVFDDDINVDSEGLHITDHAEWWKGIGPRESHGVGATPPVPQSDTEQEVVVGDEHQRQSTPPRSLAQRSRRIGLVTGTESKTSSKVLGHAAGETDSTTDESADDTGSSPRKHPPLRADGAVLDVPADSFNDVQPEPMDLDDNGSIASTSEVKDSRANADLGTNSKVKLGKIGGKGKDSLPESSAVPKSKLKLGKIGGNAKLGKIGATGFAPGQDQGATLNQSSVSPKTEALDQNNAPKTLERERKGRSDQLLRGHSPPRETSRERANKKREMLKRELESKSQAVPKKKRRF